MMDELCVASVASSWVDGDHNNHYADRDKSEYLLHEVTVKVLGLKSVVANLKPSIRLVVATLHNGQVSSKTALSTEFGRLYEDDAQESSNNSNSMMSMAVWEDKETTDSTLFLDADLKISPFGTFAREDTELVVALTDIGPKQRRDEKETLVCTPVGIASLRIKALGGGGDVNHTTQLVPVLQINQQEPQNHGIPPFRIDNPYYKPKPNGNLKTGRFAGLSGSFRSSSGSNNKKLGKFSFRKRSHVPLDGDYSNKALIPSLTEDVMMDHEIITTTMESGVLLLDVSWRNKEFALETVLDLAKVNIESNDKVVTPMRNKNKEQQQHVKAMAAPPVHTPQDDSPTRAASKFTTTHTEEGSTHASTSHEDSTSNHRPTTTTTPVALARRGSGSVYSTAGAISTAEMTETTRPTSNTRKSRRNRRVTRDRSVSRSTLGSAASSRYSVPSSSVATNTTNGTTTTSKKKFWILPVAALKLRLGKKNLMLGKNNTNKRGKATVVPEPKIPLAVAMAQQQDHATTESSVSNLNTADDTSGSFDPFGHKQKQQQQQQDAPGSPSSMTSSNKKNKASFKVRFDPDKNANRPRSPLDFFKKKPSNDEMDEISQILGKYSSAKENDPFSSAQPPHELNFVQKTDPFGFSIGEDSLPHEVVFEDETIGDNSTITMMKGLDKDSTSVSGNQLALFNSFLPQCNVFDSDPSKLPVLEGYNNLLDDEETLATLETIDTYLKNKLRGRSTAADSWWNDGEDVRQVEEELISLGGFEYHGDTDILRARVPAFQDDDVSFVPRPEDVVWTELYKGCGVRTAEQLTDGFVMFPESMFSLFQRQPHHRLEQIEESPTMISTSSDSDGDGSLVAASTAENGRHMRHAQQRARRSSIRK